MSKSTISGRDRSVAFILKDGRRGFAIGYTGGMPGFTRFYDCAVWPENEPQKLQEFTMFEVPTELIDKIEDRSAPPAEPEATTTEAKATRRRRKAEESE